MTAAPFASHNRRHFLALSAAAAAGLATPAVAKGPATAADLATPAGRLRAFMLMRGALDDRLVIGCVSGRYYGVEGDSLTPLFGVVSATFARYRPAETGGYVGVSAEIAYFTDPEHRQVMDHWLNPYTGQEVSVPETALPASPLAITADLHLTLPKLPPGASVQHQVLAPLLLGDDLWMTEEVAAQFQIPGQPAPAHYSELVTLHGRLSDLGDSGVARVPCQTAFTAVSSWRPWMKMAGHPGHLLGNGAGLYGAALGDLPPAWRDAVATRRPQLLKDPAALLAASGPAP